MVLFIDIILRVCPKKNKMCLISTFKFKCGADFVVVCFSMNKTIDRYQNRTKDLMSSNNTAVEDLQVGFLLITN